MTHFFAMGRYAWFVWPAYALSGVALIAAAALTFGAYVRATRLLRQMRGENEKSDI